MIILKANKLNGIKIFEKSINKKTPVIFPTDTIYGIGSFINNIEANEKIFEIKGRPKNKPFPILISSIPQLENIIAERLTNNQKEILNRYWPGPFTFIFKAKKNIPKMFVYKETIAIRLPKENWITNVISYFDSPISATSANLSGCNYKNNIDEIIHNFKNKVTLYLINNLPNNKSSTIIDLTKDNLKILRK